MDLLVVGPIGLREAVRRLQTAQPLGREINPIVWTRKEFARRRREADPFLARVLDGPTIPILGEMPRPAR